MKTAGDKALQWSPRILGILVALFLGVFSLDAFGDEGLSAAGVAAFLIHSLPSIGLLLIVAASWRREWLGGSVFLALAAVYAAVMVRHVDWTLAIAGPLAVVGVLYLLGWRRGGAAPA